MESVLYWMRRDVMEWLKNLSKAVEYIENHLDKDLSYDEAARIACCSTSYFQRMFSYVAGISLSEYVRRRRMTQAAFELQSTDCRVLDIGLKYGYGSPTSFNRAFQQVHGISPVMARGRGCFLNAYPPIRFSVQVTGETPMPYRVEEKKAVRIVGVTMPLTQDMEENHRAVPPFWSDMMGSGRISDICALANQEPMGIIGATVYHGSGGISYCIGVATDMPVPEGMLAFDMPAATWVVFQCSGPYKETVQGIFRRFLTEWLPFSGYTYTELPNLEVYPFGNEQSPGGEAEVWIAVKKEAGSSGS